MSAPGKPVIGEELYRQLSELTEAARLHATSTRNFHSAALCVALEALRTQAELSGSAVSVYIAPRRADR